MADISRDLASLRIARDEPPKTSGKRRLLIALGVVVAAVASYGGYRLIESRLLKPVVELGVVTTLSPAQADVKLMATGYVVPQRRAMVAARQQGRISKLHVVEGQEVKEGALIASLESDDPAAALSEARAGLLTAQARLAAARANLAEAELQLSREKQLMATNTTNQAALDTAQSRSDVARANVQAAEADVATARARAERAQVTMDNTRIVAPFSGRVVRKLVETGEIPNQQNAVVELVDFNTLVLEADVSESKIGQVRLDDPAEMTLDAYPTVRHRGQVAEIRPTVDKQKATVLVKVKFVDPVPGILPQMAGRVLFLSHALDAEKLKEPAKIVVPAAAIVEREGSKVVFTAGDGRVRLVSIVVGDRLGEAYELKQGPAPGTKVVLRPDERLEDGTSVKEKS